MTMPKTHLPNTKKLIIDKDQIKDLLRLCNETYTLEVIEEGKVWH
jgi:hypothetical protein